ncbi:MAG: helix-turn-helix transcriptional regulator [Ruminococcus sp.]|nr:helix-turn-helix transcriptional regulator [Ruminococcus sp.]
MPVIDMKATGSNIRSMIRSKGFRIADVQAKCGFNTPQAIFKWMRGDAVPTIDNMIILADMLGVTIDQIVVITRV